MEAALAGLALTALIAVMVIARKNREIRARVAQVNQLKEQLETISVSDALTGLYNRRYMDEQLKMALSYAKRQQSPLTIAVADIDLFRSEEHTSELQSHSEISYAVFCLKKKK